MATSLRAGLLAILLPAARGSGLETPARARQPLPDSGVVAIGDVHGDAATFRGLLRSAGLLDSGGRWSGGRRRMVQTGDVLDRGPHSRQALDLLMRLSKEAAAAGGSAVMVLGNHELMTICGDLRYTTREEFTAFAGEEGRELRDARKREILGLIRRGSPLLRSPYYAVLARFIDLRTFDDRFPPGFFARERAFAPAGRYGKWLLERPVIHREGKTIFLHGGLSAAYGEIPAAELNRRIPGEVRKFLGAVEELESREVFDLALGLEELIRLLEDERRAGGPHPSLAAPFRAIEEVLDGILFDDDGPLWYRGLALDSEASLAPVVRRILAAQGADRIVIGHTQPLALRVESRFGGRVYLIDTGMNRAVYKGHPSALFISPSGEVRVWQRD
jgi:calcineurin-like phosphoesterase family protein